LGAASGTIVLFCRVRPVVTQPHFLVYIHDDGSVRSIADTFCKRTAAALQSGRGGLIAPKSEQPEDDDDFELITWLAIKEGKTD
jgi:hypothetical protein